MNQSNNELKLYMKLRVYHKEPSFGPGMCQLMHEVDRLGSMSKACKSLGMAYSKAWKIVNRAEADFGFKLFISTSGGINGGGMVLTPEGRELMEKFEAFEKKAREVLEDMMCEFFSKEN